MTTDKKCGCGDVQGHMGWLVCVEKGIEVIPGMAVRKSSPADIPERPQREVEQPHWYTCVKCGGPISGRLSGLMQICQAGGYCSKRWEPTPAAPIPDRPLPRVERESLYEAWQSGWDAAKAHSAYCERYGTHPRTTNPYSSRNV